MPFAPVGRPSPVYRTAQVNGCGGPIPGAGFALIGSETIGKQVLAHIGDDVAALLKNDGVFTVGKNGVAAIKAALMAEDVATLHDRYMNAYGQ